MDAGRGKAEARQKARWGESHEHMKAHGRTDATAPYEMANRNAGGIQELVEFFTLVRLCSASRQAMCSMSEAQACSDRTWSVVWQERKGGLEVTLSKAGKSSLAGKTGPLAREGKNNEVIA